MISVAIFDWPTGVAHASFTVFHQALAQALIDLGHRVGIFHDADSARRAGVADWDCSLAIGSHYRCHDGGTPLYETLGLPHFQWIVDTPFKAILPDHAHPLLRAIVIDEEFVGRPGLPGRGTMFLPLGTSMPARVAPEQRRFDLVFTGQVKDPDQDWRALNTLAPGPRALARCLVDGAMAAPDSSLLGRFDADAPRFGLAADAQARAFLAANSFLRSWKRRRVLLSLAELRVDVFGEVRDPRCLAAAHLHRHGAFPYHRLGAILAASRMALNVTPNFHAACHDRIIAALACGTLAVTDTNPCLDAYFPDGRGILGFRHADLGTLASRIRAALRTGAWAPRAAAGRQVVEKEFTWNATAARLAEHLRHAAADMKNLYENQP